jgi:NAD-dependent deacetylase
VYLPVLLISALRNSSQTVVLTGSGISAESGVPTFREAQTSLWARFDPQKLATPEAFARDPKLVWDWYAWRRKLVRKLIRTLDTWLLRNSSGSSRSSPSRLRT